MSSWLWGVIHRSSMVWKSREAKNASSERSCLMRKLGPENMTWLWATFKGVFFKLSGWNLTASDNSLWLKITSFTLPDGLFSLLFHLHHFFANECSKARGIDKKQTQIDNCFFLCWDAMKLRSFFFCLKMFLRSRGQRILGELNNLEHSIN